MERAAKMADVRARPLAHLSRRPSVVEKTSLNATFAAAPVLPGLSALSWSSPWVETANTSLLKWLIIGSVYGAQQSTSLLGHAQTTPGFIYFLSSLIT
ncbi:hypothetical protein XELAEV_18042239mg [Xenopus laevis]|uniref:Uncharacterized protein n=1 Tax=Xenopus laevis TaxID=8355 RepID=A0A974C4V9_XENLA|nr:hypothetical protein XELAEV_18042239mg [Xenopus laevis]